MQPRGVLAATIVFQVLTIILPILRCWAVRRYGGTQTRSQNVAAGFYWLGCCCVFVLNCFDFSTLHDEIQVRSKWPGPIADLMMMTPYYIKRIICTGLVYYCALWSFKGAFLAFYWSLFTRAESRARYALLAVMGLVGATFLCIFIVYLSTCRPFPNNWSPDVEILVSCSIMYKVHENTAAYSMDLATDLCILLIPLGVITRLGLGRAERYALAFIFLIGTLSPVAGTVRYIFIRKIISDDSVHYSVQRVFNFLSSIEYWAAMVAFTLPAFRMWLLHLLGKHGQISAIRRQKKAKEGSGGSSTLMSVALGRTPREDEEMGGEVLVDLNPKAPSVAASEGAGTERSDQEAAVAAHRA